MSPLIHAVLIATAALLVWRLRDRPDIALLGLSLGVFVAVAALAGSIATRLWALTIFYPIQVLAWALLAYLPALLLAIAVVWRRRAPRAAAAVALPGLIGALIGLDAAVIEPVRLEVVHHTVRTEGVDLRIVLLADIQTDHIGAYEARVFEEVRRQEPDLVLFAGDYVQLYEIEAFTAQSERLRSLLAALEAPLGAYAVAGDVDPKEVWHRTFEDTGVQILANETVTVGPIQLTGLSPLVSHKSDARIPEVEGFHIVLGHAPDYSMAPRNGADLLMAGHTHGGQVQVPFFGPLLTFSRVPRDQAAGGLFELEDGSHLVVSRGIGLERLDAPRLRFFCRPELTVIDLVSR